MNLRCLAYRALDRFKRSALGARSFYRGVPIRVNGPVTVDGRVTRATSSEPDGDCTFDLTLDDGSFRHCEITPCQPAALRRLACSLKVGARVRVSGIDRFDPAHIGDGGHLGSDGWEEVHPVTGIEVLQ